MIIQIKNAIFSKTFKDTSVILTGNAVSALLAVVFTIFAARFLGPESWGIVAAVISLVVIVEAVGDLGLGSSLFLFVSKDWNNGDKEKANSTLSTIFLIRVITAFVLLIILIILANILDQIILKANGPLLIILGALTAFAYLLFDFQIMAMQAKHSWVLSAFFNVLANLIRLILVIILFLTNNISVINILLILMLSPFVAFMLSLIYFRVKINFRYNWDDSKAKIVPFSGWLGINRIASSIISRLDIILLLLFLDQYQTGIFAAAKQLAIGVPLVVGSMATAIAPRLASLEKDSLILYFKKAVLLSLLTTAGLAVGIFITPQIVQFFGTKYAASSLVLQLLLVGYIPFVLSMPAINLLIYSLGKPKVIGITALLQLPIIYFCYLLIIPIYGLSGAALVNGLWHFSTMVFAYSFAFYYLKKQKLA